VWPVASYGSESWTLKAADKKRLEAFEMTAYRRIMRISWTERRTNQSILDELSPSHRFLTTIQRRKLKYFGAENLSTDILHGRVNGMRSRGRQRRRWSDDVKDWTGLSIPECIIMTKDRTAWRSFITGLQQQQAL